MHEKLTPEEQEKVAAIIGVALLLLGVVVAIIYAARVIFWVSIVVFFLSIAYFVISIIFNTFRVVVDDEEYFDGGFPHGLFAVGLMFLFWTSAHISFPIGYSPTSEKILEFAGEVEKIQGLPMQIQREALQEVCKTTQVNPACDMINTFMDIRETSEEYVDVAETLTWIFNLKVKLPS